LVHELGDAVEGVRVELGLGSFGFGLAVASQDAARLALGQAVPSGSRYEPKFEGFLH
jgi:hypothetical protein